MTRKSRTIILPILVGIGLCLPVIYWITQPYWQTHRKAHESENYLDRLANEIEGSDRIDLIEHSWYHLEKSESGGTLLIQEPIEFRRVTLSPEQRRELAEIVRRTNPALTCSSCPGSIEVHHTIVFRRNGAIHSRFDLCFGSHALYWYMGRNLTSIPVSGPYPEDLLQRMRKWIESQGMNPVDDWQKLAEQHADGKPPEEIIPPP